MPAESKLNVEYEFKAPDTLLWSEPIAFPEEYAPFTGDVLLIPAVKKDDNENDTSGSLVFMVREIGQSENQKLDNVLRSSGYEKRVQKAGYAMEYGILVANVSTPADNYHALTSNKFNIETGEITGEKGNEDDRLDQAKWHYLLIGKANDGEIALMGLNEDGTSSFRVLCQKEEIRLAQIDIEATRIPEQTLTVLERQLNQQIVEAQNQIQELKSVRTYAQVLGGAAGALSGMMLGIASSEVACIVTAPVTALTVYTARTLFDKPLRSQTAIIAKANEELTQIQTARIINEGKPAPGDNEMLRRTAKGLANRVKEPIYPYNVYQALAGED